MSYNCFAFCGIYGDSYRDNLKRMTPTPTPLEKKKGEKRKKKKQKGTITFLTSACLSIVSQSVTRPTATFDFQVTQVITDLWAAAIIELT